MEIGSLVQLKNCKTAEPVPIMVVNERKEPFMYECLWFVGGILQREVFNVDVLMLVEDLK